MRDSTRLIVLRDCFTAGYTFPQYCIDNEIKKPLIVTEKIFINFMWELYVQFRYDKRLTAQFATLDAPAGEINYSLYGIIAPLAYKNFSEINTDAFDKIIFLTSDKKFPTDKAIYLDALTVHFVRKAYAEIPLLNFLQRFPGVKLFLTNFPKVQRYKDGLKFQQQLKLHKALQALLLTDKSGKVKTPLDKFGYTNEEVFVLLEAEQSTTNPDGTVTVQDNDHPLRMIQNGKRMTAYQPEKFLNRIYFVGSCHHEGIYAPFDKTIESYLQKMLNDNNLPYRVENESHRCWFRYQDIFYDLNSLTPAPGDIIFVWLADLPAKNIPFIDVSDAFDPPHNYKDFFSAKRHLNELGYKVLAEKYFDVLTQNNFFRDKEFKYPTPPPTSHRYGIPSQFEQGGAKISYGAELEAYKENLRAKKLPIGAIVMNCNPFTLGHQYLVEYAAAKVARLYIFVVEEDKSEFPFADRIELVRQGVKNFSNVEVLPSGKFIISQQTFSGYFNKAELQDVQVDSSEDVEIFGREIAPTLGITVRFAGEEPKDNVTRQYNETMKRILPRYGVEFCEIPRREISDEPISASSVREALKRGDFDKIKSLVPDTTLLYLRGRYSAKKIL